MPTRRLYARGPKWRRGCSGGFRDDSAGGTSFRTDKLPAVASHGTPSLHFQQRPSTVLRRISFIHSSKCEDSSPQLQRHSVPLTVAACHAVLGQALSLPLTGSRGRARPVRARGCRSESCLRLPHAARRRLCLPAGEHRYQSEFSPKPSSRRCQQTEEGGNAAVSALLEVATRFTSAC